MNEIQTLSKPVEKVLFYLSGDNSYIGNTNELLKYVENKYILPNIENLDSYYDGKVSGNFTSMMSGLDRASLGLALPIISIVKTAVKTMINSAGGHSTVSAAIELVFAVTVGTAIVYNGLDLAETSANNLFNGDNRSSGNSIEGGRKKIHLKEKVKFGRV